MSRLRRLPGTTVDEARRAEIIVEITLQELSFELRRSGRVTVTGPWSNLICTHLKPLADTCSPDYLAAHCWSGEGVLVNDDELFC